MTIVTLANAADELQVGTIRQLTTNVTVDHRAVDGAEGADFLRTVKSFVEEPALAL